MVQQMAHVPSDAREPVGQDVGKDPDAQGLIVKSQESRVKSRVKGIIPSGLVTLDSSADNIVTKID